MCQSPPQGESLHPCPQELREKVLLTCNESTLKNGVCAGGSESSERKKDNGEGSRGERGTLWPREENAMLLFSQTKWKNTTKYHDNEVLHWRCWEFRLWHPPCRGLPFGEWDQASEAMIHVLASKCGQLTRKTESWELDHKRAYFNISEHVRFWFKLFPPFQTALQACSTDDLLNQAESRSVPEATRKTFLRREWFSTGC